MTTPTLRLLAVPRRLIRITQLAANVRDLAAGLDRAAEQLDDPTPAVQNQALAVIGGRAGQIDRELATIRHEIECVLAC